MLIKDAFSMYEEEEIIAGGLSKKTLESYVYAEKLASDYFSATSNIEDIQPIDVRSFYQHLLTWQKPDTARGKVIAMKRRGYAEINRLRNIAIVKLLYYSSLRVGELCCLNRNSIRNRQFSVVGKSKESRLCFVNEETEKAIEDYLKARTDKNPALFISNENEKRITPDTIRRVFANACERSEFEGVHPHTLRHSFATTMLDRDVDLIYIGQLLGHESLDTTKMYTHYANPKLKRIYDMAMCR